MAVDDQALGLAAMVAALREGSRTPAEVAAQVVERAAAAAAHLGAIAHLDATQLAHDVATSLAAHPDGPLSGAPLAVKDNINTATHPTTAGTGALQGNTPSTDAGAVQRLRGAGGVVGAKTAMHELAFGITSNNAVTGPVRNPHDTRMIAGGSSGGTAAAVAAGILPAGLGTDTGGSCRIPAALCGVVGFRPTTGRYPGDGIVPISHTRDTVGAIARDVTDVALLDAVLAGEDAAGLSLRDLAGVTLGVPRGVLYDDLDGHVERAVEAQLDRLAAAGATLVEVDLGDIWAYNEAFGFPVVLYEVVRGLPAYLEQHAPTVSFEQLVAGIGSPDVAGVLGSQLGEGAMPEAAYRAALDTHRPAMRAQYAAAFEAHGLDALAFPTTPLPARPIGDDETVELDGEQVPTFATYIRNTDLGSNIGAPGITLPLPVGDGLPVGIELDGLPGADRALLALAAAIEPSTQG